MKLKIKNPSCKNIEEPVVLSLAYRGDGAVVLYAAKGTEYYAILSVKNDGTVYMHQNVGEMLGFMLDAKARVRVKNDT